VIDTCARRSARQLLSAEFPTPTVLEALRERIGDAAALRTMRELVAERRAAAEGRAVAKQDPSD
jgi:hypothetical protein